MKEWIEACERAQSAGFEDRSTIVPPPDSLGLDEIRVHPGLDGKDGEGTSGCWLLWTRLGPLSVNQYRFSHRRWYVSPDRYLSGYHQDQGRELKAFCERAGFSDVAAMRRADVIQIVRAALAREGATEAREP